MRRLTPGRSSLPSCPPQSKHWSKNLSFTDYRRRQSTRALYRSLSPVPPIDGRVRTGTCSLRQPAVGRSFKILLQPSPISPVWRGVAGTCTQTTTTATTSDACRFTRSHSETLFRELLPGPASETSNRVYNVGGGRSPSL